MVIGAIAGEYTLYRTNSSQRPSRLTMKRDFLKCKGDLHLDILDLYQATVS